jgi:hypothetical protein
MIFISHQSMSIDTNKEAMMEGVGLSGRGGGGGIEVQTIQIF